jgi:hypothetical protein
MRLHSVVIALGIAFLGGCYGGYYHHRYYGGGYYGGYTYSAYQQQPAPQQQVVAGPPVQGQPGVVGVQAQAVAGEGIAGSDGTRGWRVTVQAPEQEFQRLAQVAMRTNCQVENSTQTELRAICNGNVHVVVRFDQTNVYKLCAPGTDPNVCTQIWASMN